MSFDLGTTFNFLPTLNKSRFLYGQFKMYTRTMEYKTFKLNRSIFHPNTQYVNKMHFIFFSFDIECYLLIYILIIKI